MAHELAQTAVGTYLCAYREQRRADVWHADETEPLFIGDDEPVEALYKAGGMRARITRAMVRYPMSRDAGNDPSKWGTMSDQHVLLSDVTGSPTPLGVVSDKFQIVQPRALSELADRIATIIDGRVDAVMTLFGGRVLSINICAGETRLFAGDILKTHFLLTTANDGTEATVGKASECASICNNTRRVALGSGAVKAADFRLTHRLEFKPERLAAYWAAAVAGAQAQVEQARMLAQVPVRHDRAERIIFDLFNDKRADGSKQVFGEPVPAGKRDIRNTAGYKTILGLFAGAGRGATNPGRRGTAWGLLNAVTEYVDHHAQAASEAHRWSSAQSGHGAALKEQAEAVLVALATADA